MVSTISIPLTPAFRQAIEAAGFHAGDPAASVMVPVDEATLSAMMQAGFMPPAADGKRQQVVTIDGRLFTQTEMRDNDLMEWLLLARAAGELLDEARQGGDDARICAVAQVANVDLVSRALRITQDEAWQLPISVRRGVVVRQDALNNSEVYAALMEA